MILELQSTDGDLIAVEYNILRGCSYFAGAMEVLGEEGVTSEPFNVPCNSEELRLAVNCLERCTEQSFSLKEAEAEFRRTPAQTLDDGEQPGPPNQTKLSALIFVCLPMDL
jgi:hypothetical protein